MHVGGPAGASARQASVVVEPALGGRCSSLRSPAGREWLAHRPEAARARAGVRPGDPFVDVGGLEECFPTIAGAFDHGDVWSKPWDVDNDVMTVDGAGCRLQRTITVQGGDVVFSYHLTAEPGFQFVWAGHASLALSDWARIQAPVGARVRLWPDHWRTYPDLKQHEGPWPAPLGVPLDGLAEDGTAVFAMLLDIHELKVEDGGDRLTFRLETEGQPAAMALWRNLGRWPEDQPYRSVAIEPAIGRHFDRDMASAEDVGVVPDTGVAEWRLIMSMTDAIRNEQ